MKECNVCGCPMCVIYQCDPFYGGCGFEDYCDELEDADCPNCEKKLSIKHFCHQHCGHVEKLRGFSR